eukprot:12410234-Ditylum_brightwellii.AAC.1
MRSYGKVGSGLRGWEVGPEHSRIESAGQLKSEIGIKSEVGIKTGESNVKTGELEVKVGKLQKLKRWKS